MNLINVSQIKKNAGGVTLFGPASFQINEGDKIGLVGVNGAGKTTLFRLLTKEDSLDGGEIAYREHLRMSYFSQNVGEWKDMTSLQIVMEGSEKITKLSQQMEQYYRDLESPDLAPEQMEKILERLGGVQSEFEQLGGHDLESRAEEVLTGLGIHPNVHHKQIQFFSGGQKMRVALAKALVMLPELIIMDEPTNYLDMETIEWLEVWLKNYKGSLIMTTHDRYFMNAICNKILEISHGKMTAYSGNYDFYEIERKSRREKLIAEQKRQMDSIAKDEEFIARFKARASHAAQVQSRVKQLEKIDRIEIPAEEESVQFEFPTPPRGGDDVVIFKNLGHCYAGENSTPLEVFSGLTGIIKRGEKIAVVGVNGAGKSTFLKILVKKLNPTTGSLELGPSTKLGYFGQFTLDELNPNNTILGEMSESCPDFTPGYLRNMLAAFLFRGDDVEKPIRILSGGEKARLLLTKIMSKNPNFLVLDEPTNHLDIASREVLLNALKKFQGTFVLVSHDRFFLREAVQQVMEITNKKVNFYPGNFDYYLSKKGRLA